MSSKIIAIDGPAGAGKSTVARKLANKLGFIHLNSGSLYRAVGLKADAAGISFDDEAGVVKLAESLQFEFRVAPSGETELFVNGEAVGSEISGESAGTFASRIGVLPEVRAVLTRVQQQIAEHSSVVVEGRDAGTIVFPHADAKFYLDARAEVRAERRFRETVSTVQSGGPSLKEIEQAVAARDERDSNRTVAPQQAAEDAQLIDTSDISIDEVVLKITELVGL